MALNNIYHGNAIVCSVAALLFSKNHLRFSSQIAMGYRDRPLNLYWNTVITELHTCLNFPWNWLNKTISSNHKSSTTFHASGSGTKIIWEWREVRMNKKTENNFWNLHWFGKLFFLILGQFWRKFALSVFDGVDNVTHVISIRESPSSGFQVLYFSKNDKHRINVLLGILAMAVFAMFCGSKKLPAILG